MSNGYGKCGEFRLLDYLKNLIEVYHHSAMVQLNKLKQDTGMWPTPPSRGFLCNDNPNDTELKMLLIIKYSPMTPTRQLARHSDISHAIITLTRWQWLKN